MKVKLFARSLSINTNAGVSLDVSGNFQVGDVGLQIEKHPSISLSVGSMNSMFARSLGCCKICAKSTIQGASDPPRTSNNIIVVFGAAGGRGVCGWVGRSVGGGWVGVWVGG